MKSSNLYSKEKHEELSKKGYEYLKSIVTAVKRRTELGVLDIEEITKECYPSLKKAMLLNDYVSEHDVSFLIPGLTIDVLRNLRRKGEGPKFAKLGRHKTSQTVYKASDIFVWLERITVCTRDCK